MCGEKNTPVHPHTSRMGSPPHVRGKGLTDICLALKIGITPACAGKRHPIKRGDGSDRDHPRMCGEKEVCVFVFEPVLGSPPHVRGKGTNSKTALPHDRITPACAGKSSICPTTTSTTRDHPRMCGEKVLPASLLSPVPGSPPHVRGKGSKTIPKETSMGITPACAGKRAGETRLFLNEQDHPRMCGEKTKKIP